MLEWVWRRVAATDLFSSVVIATDSEEVAGTAMAFGAEVELTLESHPSGTDRVAEVARLPRFSEIDLVVNIQGDEPFVRADHLAAALALVRDENWEIGTVASLIESYQNLRDPAVVKVVRADDGSALLFSRAPIPHVRDGEPSAEQLGSGVFLRHIGIYAYQRHALLEWVSRPEGELERLEKLEQLRPLAAGFRIGVSLVEAAAAGVDTLEDAERAERQLETELRTAAL